jgi:hypothetical protein
MSIDKNGPLTSRLSAARQGSFYSLLPGIFFVYAVDRARAFD